MSLPFIALALTTTGPDPRRDRVSAVSTVTVDASGERTRFDAVVYSAESIGERPAGVVGADSPIVQTAARTLAALGLEPSFDASSTDANVPIAAGIPAVCVGLTTGGNVHRTDEYIDVEPVPMGVTQLALLALALAESLSERAL